MTITPLTSSPSLTTVRKTAPPQPGAEPAVAASDTVQLGPSSQATAPGGLKPQGGAAALDAAAGASSGPAAAASLLQTGFVEGYIEPKTVFEKCQQLAKKYPDLCELVVRPYQTHGYDGKAQDIQGPAPLYYLRLGPQSADRDSKVGVVQFASPHAREWVQPMIISELAEELLANYDPQSSDPAVQANTALLQGLDICLCPMSNPDGTNYSMHDDKSWRKNRQPTPQKGTFGVDCNRNYDFEWQSSDKYNSQVYPGPAAMSEPETRNIAGIVDDHPNVRFVVDWHSYSQEVRRPWGVSAEDNKFYDKFHARVQTAINSVRGSEYKTTVSEVVRGASDDYFYNRKGLYSTIIEDGTAFQPDTPEAVGVMKECVAGAREVLQVALEFSQQQGLAQAHPPAVPPAPPD